MRLRMLMDRGNVPNRPGGPCGQEYRARSGPRPAGGVSPTRCRACLRGHADRGGIDPLTPAAKRRRTQDLGTRGIVQVAIVESETCPPRPAGFRIAQRAPMARLAISLER